jgi:hypothetical protein
MTGIKEIFMNQNYKMNDELKNNVTGEIIKIEFPSNNGCYYKNINDGKLQFVTFATLEKEYQKVETVNKERKFVDTFTKGYLEKCELFKNTPPEKWGEIFGNVGEDLKQTILALENNIDAMGEAIEWFKI